MPKVAILEERNRLTLAISCTSRSSQEAELESEE